MGSAVFDEFQLSETDFSATSFSATSFPATTMNSSHNFLSSMDRLSASLSTPLGSRTAMERDFDRKFMSGIKTRPESNTYSSSAGSSFAQSQSPLSTGLSATSIHSGTGSYGTSNYSQSSRRALHQDSTFTSRSTPTYSHISPACGKSYKTYNSMSSF